MVSLSLVILIAVLFFMISSESNLSIIYSGLPRSRNPPPTTSHSAGEGHEQKSFIITIVAVVAVVVVIGILLSGQSGPLAGNVATRLPLTLSVTEIQGCEERANIYDESA